MEVFTLIIEVLIVLLLIAIVVVVIKCPKDIVVGFFGFLKPELYNIYSWVFFPIWLIGRSIELVTRFEIYEKNQSDFVEEPYKSTKNMKFDFEAGTKYLVSHSESNNINKILKDFSEIARATTFDDFVMERISPTVIRVHLVSRFMILIY